MGVGIGRDKSQDRKALRESKGPTLWFKLAGKLAPCGGRRLPEEVQHSVSGRSGHDVISAKPASVRVWQEQPGAVPGSLQGAPIMCSRRALGGGPTHRHRPWQLSLLLIRVPWRRREAPDCPELFEMHTTFHSISSALYHERPVASVKRELTAGQRSSTLNSTYTSQ